MFIDEELASMMRKAIEKEKKDGDERGFVLCEKNGRIFADNDIIRGSGRSINDEFEGCQTCGSRRVGFFHTHSKQKPVLFSFHDYADMGNDLFICIGNVHGDIKCATSQKKRGGLNRKAWKILKEESKAFDKKHDILLCKKGVMRGGSLVLPDDIHGSLSEKAALRLEKRLAKNNSFKFKTFKI